MEERLQKFLANSGIDSRRKCEQHILEGRVQVNGKIVTELGIKINPEKDIILFNRKRSENSRRKSIYFIK